jgi:hypothetical protein
MKATQRVSALRSGQPDDLIASGAGCEGISLRGASMRRKIGPNRPGIRGMSVTIGKSMSLIGADADKTVINATGNRDGIYIYGLDNPSLSEVMATRFTIQNAKFEGIPRHQCILGHDCGQPRG